jgi:hypothetical protein
MAGVSDREQRSRHSATRRRLSPRSRGLRRHPQRLVVLGTWPHAISLPWAAPVQAPARAEVESGFDFRAGPTLTKDDARVLLGLVCALRDPNQASAGGGLVVCAWRATLAALVIALHVVEDMDPAPQRPAAAAVGLAMRAAVQTLRGAPGPTDSSHSGAKLSARHGALDWRAGHDSPGQANGATGHGAPATRALRAAGSESERRCVATEAETTAVVALLTAAAAAFRSGERGLPPVADAGVPTTALAAAETAVRQVLMAAAERPTGISAQNTAPAVTVPAMLVLLAALQRELADKRAACQPPDATAVATATATATVSLQEVMALSARVQQVRNQVRRLALLTQP